MRATQTLAATIDMMEATNDAPYSVAWLDCVTTGVMMGRGLVMLGRHAGLEDLPRDKARIQTGESFVLTTRKLTGDETLAYDVSLPPRPWLELAVGAVGWTGGDGWCLMPPERRQPRRLS